MSTRSDHFMLYGKSPVDCFSSSQLLHRFWKVSLRLIRARPNFYVTIDNSNIGLGIVNFPLYSRRFALVDDFYKKE